MNRLRKSIPFFSVLVVLSALIILLSYLIRPKYDSEYSNPFALQLDKLGEIPSDAIGYEKAGTIEVPFNNPLAIALDRDDRLYVSGEQQVAIYDESGNMHNQFPVQAPIYALAVYEGLIYAGEEKQVRLYNAAGEVLAEWESLGQNARITSLAVDEDHVYVADAGQKFIFRFAHQGRLTQKIGRHSDKAGLLQFIVPSFYFDVDISPDGTLWAANPGKQRLIHIDKEGSVRRAWGASSSALEGFSGCCNPSHFTLLSDGSFITAEKGLVRVKRYTPEGELATVVAPPSAFQARSEGLDVATDSHENVYILEPKAKIIHIFRAKKQMGL